MQHLDEGTIHAWLDGALPASEAEAVETHVAQCAECAALVAEARGLIAGASRIVSSLDHVPVGVIPRPQSKPQSIWHTLRLTPARASIAALLLVGIASMFTARRAEQNVSHPVSSAAGHPERSEGPPRERNEGASPKVSHPERTEGPSPQVSHPQRTEGPSPQVSHPERSEGPLSPATNSTAPTPSAGIAASKAAAEVATVDTVHIQRDSVRAERSFTGAAAPMAPQRMARMLDAPAGSPEGCYRLLSDSARMIAMPERFALQRDSIGRSVVLRLSVDNTPDGVLSGFTWRQMSPSVATLTAPATQLVLTTSASGRGRLESTTGSADVPLLRTTCRP